LQRWKTPEQGGKKKRQLLSQLEKYMIDLRMDLAQFVTVAILAGFSSGTVILGQSKYFMQW
jgi:hypothetical protein